MKNVCRSSLLFICIVFIITACADISETPLESTSAENTTENGMGLDLSAMEYNPDTDAQSEFIGSGTGSSVARSEHGYYYWVQAGGGFIMYYDISSGKKVPLCNRPDCRHDNTDCNAWYPSIMGLDEEDVHYDSAGAYISFYNGSLYIIGCDQEDYVSLYKVTEDGGSRELSTRLFKADYSASDGSGSKDYPEWQCPEVCIHRGYAYFIDPREKQSVLRRVKLGDSEPEVIYESAGGDLLEIYRMKAYGNYLFFQVYDASINNSLSEEGLYAYDIRTGGVQLVKKDIIANYAIADGVLYYQFDGGIYKCSLEMAEEVLLVENTDVMDFAIDGQHLYVFDEESGILGVYDSNGKLISKIEDKNLVQGYCGCDSQYMFVRGNAGGIYQGSASVEVQDGMEFADLLAKGNRLMAIMDLSELQQGKGKWTYLYDFDYLNTE